MSSARWAPSVQGAGARARALTSAAAEERQKEERGGWQLHARRAAPHEGERPPAAAAAIVAECRLTSFPHELLTRAMLAASLFGSTSMCCPNR